MRIGLLGRSEILLNTAKALLKNNVEIVLLHTCRSENYYQASENDLKEFCNAQNIDFISDVNFSNHLKTWKQKKPDLILSFNWLTVLSQQTLDDLNCPVINAHAGDLPRYKGNACPNWAILNHEEKIALSLHKMTGELDSGPIAAKAYFDLNQQLDISDVYDWLRKTIPELFCDLVQKHQNQKLDFKEQDQSIKALRCYPRKPEDSQIFWNAPKEDILALIRASAPPFAGAFCFLNEEKITIFKAKIHTPGFDFSAMPGQVCLKQNNNPVIAARDGMIELLQTESKWGGHEETAKEILKSLRNRLT